MPVGPMVGDERVRMIADEIERYLATRPDAADTFGGINRWWLARLQLEDASGDVQRALDLLVQRKVVVKTILPDGNALYGNAHKGN